MGANKRTFSRDRITEAYKENGYEGITKYVGKTDIFFFSDDFSHKVIEAWSKSQNLERFFEDEQY